jgi:glycosyltransferase involved in cell wall biosynthesis
MPGDGSSLQGRNVLMLVENLSVPFDRRVWDEARALAAAGSNVTIICPRGIDRDGDAHEERDGVRILRYEPGPAGGGAAGYVREYGIAFARIAKLVRRLARTERYHIVHAANPPDLLLLAALPLRRHSRFVFDHHDLAPELFEARFGRRGPVYWALRLLERISFSLAHVVIATNESYAEIATQRGGKSRAAVFVVRNAPDTEVFQPSPPRASLDGTHLLAYVGMMGPQDGVDQALLALARLRDHRGDWRAVFAGDGDARPGLEHLAAELGLLDRVEFAGLVSQAEVIALLDRADVCLAPEPSSPLNERSTMIKVAEYMAMCRPVVAFDLTETRRTAGPAAAYAPPGDVDAFAERISGLLADPGERIRLGELGRERVVSSLSWRHSTTILLAAYAHALAADGRRGGKRR